MKNKIIEECKKYGYELNWEGDNFYSFRNDNVREELQVFDVQIDYELESVTMAIIIDLGSWNIDSLECDLNNEEEVLKAIGNWLKPENLKSIEEWLNE